MERRLPSSPLPSQDWDFLQEQADQFREALAKGTPLDWNRFLPPPSSHLRLPVLVELIKTDLDFRWGRRQTALLESYLEKFPELRAEPGLVAQLLYEEMLARRLHGDRSDLPAYQARFPQEFEDLTRLLAAKPLPSPRPALPAPAPPETLFTPGLPPSPTTRAPAAEPVPSSQTLPETRPPRPAGHRDTVPGAQTNAENVLLVAEGYKLLRRIGRGQYGEVWLAEAPGGVRVAIKRIFRALDDEATLRESQSLELLKSLNHPYLLQTHAYWPLDDRLVIVMELADGTLGGRFRECREAGLPGIPPDELLAYFEQAATALDYLHGQNVVHRDVKPENLLVLKGFAKVGDFGLARIMENSSVNATLCGTPSFMAPETWTGHLSVHMDQYSLAAAYFQMRTGRPVFPGPDQYQLARQHLEDAPDLAPLNGPEARALLRALSKKPEDRFPSCKAFVKALAEAFAPPPPPPSPPAPPPVAASRWMTFGLACALVGILVVLLVVALRPLPTRVPEKVPPAVAWVPESWQPEGEEVVKDWQGRTYYQRLARDLPAPAGRVVLVAIPQAGPSDPPTFYIMQDKVWNGLYAAFDSDPKGQLLRDRLRDRADKVPDTLKNKWRLGGDAPGRPKESLPVTLGDQMGLGVEAGQERVPVFHVTAIEAHCFAEWLGGRLPTSRQWFTAAGCYVLDPDRKGPFDGDPKNTSDLAVNSGQIGPWPVDQSARDRSVYGCRNMAGNGREWTRTYANPDQEALPFPPERLLRTNLLVQVVGQSYLSSEPFQFKMAQRKPDGEYIDHESPDISFRVVLEPGLAAPGSGGDR